MHLLLNIDVADLASAEAFYSAAFGLKAARRFGDAGIEMLGAQGPLYLLQKDAGTVGAAAMGAACSPSPQPGETTVGGGGAQAPLYLLQKNAGTIGPGAMARDYVRHWTPIHCDVVVDDLDVALARALDAGAAQEGAIRQADWGRIVTVADPFGHGWCLLQFRGRGYDEIATHS